MYMYQRIVLIKNLRESLGTGELTRKGRRITRRLIKRLEKGDDLFEILKVYGGQVTLPKEV